MLLHLFQEETLLFHFPSPVPQGYISRTPGQELTYKTFTRPTLWPRLGICDFFPFCKTSGNIYGRLLFNYTYFAFPGKRGNVIFAVKPASVEFKGKDGEEGLSLDHLIPVEEKVRFRSAGHQEPTVQTVNSRKLCLREISHHFDRLCPWQP